MRELHGSKNRGRNNFHQRTIMRAMLGSDVNLNGLVIHHIDGNPSNNHPCNIIACTQEYHRSVFHNKKIEQMQKAYPTPKFTEDEYKEWLNTLEV